MKTSDILKTFHISQPTLSNWRRGYYWKDGEKQYFFSDKSCLYTIQNIPKEAENTADDLIQWVYRLNQRVPFTGKHHKIPKSLD